MAVLRSLSIDHMQRLIGSLLEQSELELIKFTNQPSKGGQGVPDAEISSSFRILIETKTARNMVDEQQVRRHLQRLDRPGETIQTLLILTPDDQPPVIIGEINDERLAWTSFGLLYQAIDELLADTQEVISEREAFLLRELQTMLSSEKLVGNEADVVVVPARHAWPEYQRHSAYICQPGRFFQTVSYLAFYSEGKIWPLIPRILNAYEHVEWGKGLHKGPLGKIVDDVCQDTNNTRQDGLTYKVLILSGPDSDETVRLGGAIINDLVAKTGRTVAFTQNQRYVSLQKLLNVKRTSELVK
ncbi:hypothetical protein CCR96_16340 [Halochromatium roseum]|nr:hypothetical protein [Halochromatium roseum]